MRRRFVHHEKYSYPNGRWSGHVQTIQYLTSGGENSIRVGIEEVLRIWDRQKAKAVPWSKAACMSWLLTVEDSDSHATNINSGGRNRQITLRRGGFEDRIDVRAPIRTLRRGGNDASISQHQISASDKKRHY